MRYLVKARLKPGQGRDLLRAIRDESLGRGSVAGDEYLCNMKSARVDDVEIFRDPFASTMPVGLVTLISVK